MSSTLLYFIRIVLFCIPETRLFGLKRFFYRLAGVKIGSNVRICSSAKIQGNGILEIGDNTWIGSETLIISSSKITIGSDVDIAPRVYIGTGTHIIDVNSPNVAGQAISKDVIIGDGCWLGVSSIVLPGVVIGKKAIIAAGAVVQATVADQTIVGGIPAKFIKSIADV